MACHLCGICPDSLNHLFLECNYSINVWKDLKKASDQETLPDRWEDIIIQAGRNREPCKMGLLGPSIALLRVSWEEPLIAESGYFSLHDEAWKCGHEAKVGELVNLNEFVAALHFIR
ncbi:hypothetical protein Tco_1402473 [Tanacetum coccineum]